MPLSWNQIDMQLDRHSFNIHAVKKTIETAANPWEGMLHDQIRKANTKVLKSLLNWLK